MASLDGFLGHFDMLLDEERNRLYAEAIKQAAADIAARRKDEGASLASTSVGNAIVEPDVDNVAQFG